MINTDSGIVKLIHTEFHGIYGVFANISRFGDLTVVAYKNEECIWMGHNILEARKVIEKDMQQDAEYAEHLSNRADEAEYLACFG